MDRSLPWWLRVIFLLVAFQALIMAVVFFQPDLVRLLVPWPATPLNARFIASLYTALGLGVLLCMRARHLAEVRIVLLGIGIATASLFLLTLPWLDKLDPFPLWWMLFYIVDPILVAISFWRIGWSDALQRTVSPLAPLWFTQVVLWVIIGLPMLLLPRESISNWPWGLSEPLAQLYSVFFLTLAVASWLASREPRWEGVRLLAIMLAALSVLVLAVSLLHMDRFKPGAISVIWFIVFGVEALVFGGLLIRQQLSPAKKGEIG